MPTRPATAAAAATSATAPFAIRLEAAACPCPLTGRPLPALAEAFTVQATDRRDAYRAAIRQKTMRLMGQTLLVFVDGVQELA